MNFLVSGASGLIGQEVINFFTEQGHRVVFLQRKSSSETAYWNFEKEIIQIDENQKIGIVIHLAGESIAEGRWNSSKKERIKTSRVKGTKLISEYFSKAKHKPKLLISCSAIGFYGNRGEEELLENSKKGVGFLSDVCQQWEVATVPAVQAGIRVANIRFGMVLSSKGGAKENAASFQNGAWGDYRKWSAIYKLDFHTRRYWFN